MHASVSVAIHINARPGLTVNPSSLDFGSADVGAPVTRGFDIGTTDGSAVNGLSVTASGTFPGTVSLAYFVSSNPVSGDSIPAFSQLHVEVTLTADESAPESGGDYDLDIEINA